MVQSDDNTTGDDSADPHPYNYSIFIMSASTKTAFSPIAHRPNGDIHIVSISLGGDVDL